jgi:hypothetical protein
MDYRRIAPQVQEQRLSRRYPIRLALRYQLISGDDVVQPGVGHSINMSSTGILIEVADRVPPGIEIKLIIEWPARIDNKVWLTFQAQGRIVRVSGGHAAVAILKHEFRTRPISLSQP